MGVDGDAEIVCVDGDGGTVRSLEKLFRLKGLAHACRINDGGIVTLRLHCGVQGKVPAICSLFQLEGHGFLQYCGRFLCPTWPGTIGKDIALGRHRQMGVVAVVVENIPIGKERFIFLRVWVLVVDKGAGIFVQVDVQGLHILIKAETNSLL